MKEIDKSPFRGMSARARNCLKLLGVKSAEDAFIAYKKGVFKKGVSNWGKKCDLDLYTLFAENGIDWSEHGRESLEYKRDSRRDALEKKISNLRAELLKLENELQQLPELDYVDQLAQRRKDRIKIVKEFEKSGMTGSAFCKLRGIVYPTLMKWMTDHRRFEWVMEQRTGPIDLELPDYPAMKLTAILTPCREGGFSVRCPEIHGAISQGETAAEALENIKDAAAGLLAMREEM